MENLPNKDGKRILYPRLVQSGQASTDYIAKILSEKSSFTRGDIKGLLQELADELAYQMGQGKSVKLDGIGTFVPSLALRIDKERETGEADSTRRNARSIVVGSINFRAEKSLIHNTNYNCDLERSQQKFRRSSQKYTTMQIKSSGQIDSGRKVYFVIWPTACKSLLERGGLFSVFHHPRGRVLRYINSARCR